MLKNSIKLFFLFCLVYFLVPTIVWAAPPIKDENYEGKFISQSVADPIVIEAGKSREVTVKIKNIGKSTWYNTGKNFVSVYTVEPNYHNSIFYCIGWVGKDQPVELTQASVKASAVGEFKIKLYAPSKAGEYTEKFYLASENKTWIKGSGFYLKVKVTPSKTVTKNTSDSSDENLSNSAALEDASAQANTDYVVEKLAGSYNQIFAPGGSIFNFKIKYYNSGKIAWKNYSWAEAGSRALDDPGLKVNIADSSWVNAKKILEKTETIASKASFNTDFYFRMPRKQGKYILRFQLMADGHTLNGGIYELPVTVTTDAPADYEETIFVSTRVLASEPMVKIGLYSSEKEVKFVSDFDYQIYVGENFVGVLSAGEVATLNYCKGTYTLDSSSTSTSSTEPIRLVPTSYDNYFTLSNYKRSVSWKGKVNFNTYRGEMDFVYSPKSDIPWVVNVLPMDLYIQGIAETSNLAAMEYVKAILVAARTYAYYHLYNGAPAESRTFDLYATTADQLYLGYNSEVLMPRVVQAANNTYGEMVTYDSKVVVTPYFGNSNGRTRLWSVVWGGADKPWLKPVECIYDKGKKLFGHGVGMSAADAAKRADKDGWTYDQLLQYYYTGVEVEKIY